MNSYIAVDVGGTQIRVAVYPDEGITALRMKKVGTVGEGTPVERIIATIRELWPTDGRENVKAIGICVPGPVDPEQGLIYNTANIPGWENLPMKKILEAEFGVPTFLGNDANLAGLAEWQFGAGRGHKNMIYFTISTGVGGGVICDGHMLLGNLGLGAELGHVFVTDAEDAPPCGCGQKGHLESFASGTGIAWFVNHELEQGRESLLAGKGKVTAKDVAAAAKAGDPLALEAFARASKYLTLAISNYLHIFNPSILIFGGGVSTVGDLLFQPVRENLPKFAFAPAYVENLRLMPAELGDEVGLLGSLAVAKMSMGD